MTYRGNVDKIARDYIVKCDAKPSFLGYGGFPASICTSVNEQVVHGIPSDKVVIKEGDIVSVDCGSIYKGYNGDAARTFEIGKVSEEAHKLVEVTKQSFFEGVKILKAGVRLGDLGYAIQSYAESFGYGVVRDLVGHGIGREMHEDPQVPNYGKQGHGMRLKNNMTIAIEPMINMGNAQSLFVGRRVDDSYGGQYAVGALRKYSADNRRGSGNTLVMRKE